MTPWKSLRWIFSGNLIGSSARAGAAKSNRAAIRAKRITSSSDFAEAKTVWERMQLQNGRATELALRSTARDLQFVRRDADAGQRPAPFGVQRWIVDQRYIRHTDKPDILRQFHLELAGAPAGIAKRQNET